MILSSKRARWLVVGGMLTALVALAAFGPELPLVGQMEQLLSDLRIAALSPVDAVPHRRIALVTITEATLATTGRRSPIDREFLARLLTQLDRIGVSAIGVDILIDQPSETKGDDALRAALSQLRTPIRFAYADDSTSPDRVQPWQAEYQRAFFSGITNPSVGFARTDLWVDQDGVVRKLPREVEAMASLAADLAHLSGAAAALPRGRIVYRRASGGEGPPFVTIAAELVANADAAQLEFLRRLLADRVVLVGVDLPDVDRHRTPIATIGGKTEAGVFVHARVLAQYLDGRTHPEPRLWLSGVIGLAMVSAGYAVGFLRSRMWVRVLVGTASLLGLWVLALTTYGRLSGPGPLVPLVGPTLAWTGALLLGVVVSRLAVSEQRNFVRRALAKYVPPSVAEELEANPAQLQIKGEKREITALFSDIEGFTTLSERLEPFRTARLLNRYLGGMTRIVLEHGGTLDKYIGDAVVAIWGAPLKCGDQAARAVACAVAMQRFGDQFIQECAAKGVAFGHTRIGVHSGPAIVGNFGGEERFQYTAIGDTMNTASRLEGANKYFGTRILVSEVTARASGRTDLIPVADIVVKGRQQSIEVWTPAPDMACNARVEYTSAYRLMAKGDPTAVGAFERLEQQNADDPLVKHYVAQARSGRMTTRTTLEGK